MQLKGRLGNCCFQAATAIALSLDNNIPFTLSSTTKDPVMQPLYFQHLVKPMPDLPAKFLREMQHNYVPIVFGPEYNGYNIMLNGFYQSEKYFKHRRKEVIESLNIPYKEEMKDYTAIHIRRGDYLTIPGKHIDNTGEFMGRAIFQLGSSKFAVFSDDIDWCKENIPKKFISEHYNPEFRFIEGNDPLTDMSILSSCKHFINSSSTFAWWGAWMGRDPQKKIFTPREWFQSTQPENTDDIIPPEWIKI